MPQQTPPREIWRLPKVKAVTGQGKTLIYAGMAAGTFPKAIAIGERAVGWASDHVQAWIDSKVRASA
ncbi:MAG TPA: AlpA family phage regulatory protein [Dyella sp.]|uniref:helix-turn-helix transcriptional regulator n=1 Tax=Dyella sp. TaxID=1869338 RepID=UPI002B63DC76|nr:AlpA family phage regulatory protein [Dyella sp.]HUB89068.1 AlpA family phage regulatory protein [Dyella sp.]